jgi:hypothetical protein
MVQAERMRLRAQRPARAHPAKQRARARHFGHHLVAERAQARDRGGRVGAVVGERRADALRAQVRGDQRDLARASLHHQADVGLGGRHALERVHAEKQPREGRDLVGGHQPRAESQQQGQLGHERDHPQPPQRDRVDTAWGIEHEIDGSRVDGGGGGTRLVGEETPARTEAPIGGERLVGGG